MLNPTLGRACESVPLQSRIKCSVATTAPTQLEAPTKPRPKPRGRSRFHAGVALVLAASMVAGFYFELPKYVTHRTLQFPAILSVHALFFISWMLLYVAQTLLVQTNNVRLHKRLGWLGVGLAAIIPPLGIATAVIMRRFDLQTFPSHDVPLDLAFLSTTTADIVAFTPCAWLGIWLRKRRDWHSRLMFLSIATVADTGFSRLPLPGANIWFFASNMAFYAAGIAHDKLTLGRVHKVYRLGVPLIVANELFAMYLWRIHPDWWVAVCRWLTGFG